MQIIGGFQDGQIRQFHVQVMWHVWDIQSQAQIQVIIAKNIIIQHSVIQDFAIRIMRAISAILVALDMLRMEFIVLPAQIIRVIMS